MFFSPLFVSKDTLEIAAVTLVSRVLITTLQIVATQIAPPFDHSVELLFVRIGDRFQYRNTYTRSTTTIYQKQLSSSIGTECTRSDPKSSLVIIWASRPPDITLRRMELSSLSFHGFSGFLGVIRNHIFM